VRAMLCSYSYAITACSRFSSAKVLPAPLLKRLAEEGKTFAELNREQAVMA